MTLEPQLGQLSKSASQQALKIKCIPARYQDSVLLRVNQNSVMVGSMYSERGTRDNVVKLGVGVKVSR